MDYVKKVAVVAITGALSAFGAAGIVSATAQAAPVQSVAPFGDHNPLIHPAASVRVAQPLPYPFTWRHVTRWIAREEHVSPASIMLGTSDSLLIITPNGHRVIGS